MRCFLKELLDSGPGFDVVVLCKDEIHPDYHQATAELDLLVYHELHTNSASLLGTG